mmetsp:Transcript_9872/g.1461  ORF Transcript_9872/g.1461 Transcript_9872/m.1461 type:complete len:196 (+) Transcript_9872:239-826(+)
MSEFLAEGFIKFGEERFRTPSLQFLDYLINRAVDQGCSIDGVVFSLKAILKVEKLRFEFLAMNGINKCILTAFEQKSGNVEAMYSTIFVLWMVTFNTQNHHFFTSPEYDLIPHIIREIRRSDHEKLLRIALITIKNLIDASPQCTEIAVQCDLLNMIDNISTRVIKDQVVAELVPQLASVLSNSVKLLSSFEKWV